jgi:hypothetical protein
MNKLELAVKISELVENGWTFKKINLGNAKVIAEHVNGGYTFFSNDNELVDWIKNYK